MTERQSEWIRPQTIMLFVGTAIAIGTMIWSAATIAAGTVNLSHSLDDFKSTVATEFTDVHMQFGNVLSHIAAIPTQDQRIGVLERGQVQLTGETTTQDQRLSSVEQAQAVMAATMSAMKADIHRIEDAGTGRASGAAR